MFTSSLFLISRTHTEFFCRAEHILYILIFHRVKWYCIFILTYAECWALIYSIIVSRINKIHEILWKLHFRRETIAISRTFRTIKHSHLFFESQAQYLFKGKVGTCHFTIIKRNITVIFREYFSLLHFDSDKIFKIIIFSHGPTITYSIFNFQLCMYYYYHCACITKH